MLMGGGGVLGETTPQRGLTEIETTLIRGFTERLLPELRLAFDDLVTVVPNIIGVESSPQFAQIAGPTDLVIAIELEVTIDRVTSKASLCIPFQSLQQSLEETSAQLQLANMQVDVDRSRVRMLNRTAEITIEVAARLRAAELSSTKLSGLKEGDVLHLGVRSDEPLTLWVGERATHFVTAGKRGRKTAVEIASPMLLDEMAFTDTLRG
jgi:flagellar motor switch protein FliM